MRAVRGGGAPRPLLHWVGLCATILPGEGHPTVVFSYVRPLEGRASLPAMRRLPEGVDPRPPGGVLRSLPGGPEPSAEGRGAAGVRRGDPGPARGGTREAEGAPVMERRAFPVMVSGSLLAVPPRHRGPDRLWQRTRPRWRWTRAQPGPTWDKHDRHHRPCARVGCETVEILKEALPSISPCRNTRRVGSVPTDRFRAETPTARPRR